MSIPQIFLQIKKKKQQCQQQLQKLGSEVSSNNAEIKNYAQKSISQFLSIYANVINGPKNPDCQMTQVSSQIRDELNHLYKDQYDKAATEELSDRDIQKALINFPGSTPFTTFQFLLNSQLKKLQTPAYETVNKIHKIMQKQATQIVSQIIIKNFPQFNVIFLQLVIKVLQKHRCQLQMFLNFWLEAELFYLYTNNVSYLKHDFGPTSKDKQKLEAKRANIPFIFQLRKRIDLYYKLVVRNLRDLVPKQVLSFLIVKFFKQLEFEALQFTSDANKLKQWLHESTQVKNRRFQYIEAVKVFQEFQKKNIIDLETLRLVKNAKKNKKICKNQTKTNQYESSDSRMFSHIICCQFQT